MKRFGRKIVKWVCVCAVLLALVLWLVPLPLPFHMSLSGVRVEGAAAAEPAALEAEGWRLCRFLRTTELRASFTVETAQGAKIYEPVECLWETFSDGPVRHAYGAWYDPVMNRTSIMSFSYCVDGTTAAYLGLEDDGQERRFVFSADGRDPEETMDFLHIEPAGN